VGTAAATVAVISGQLLMSLLIDNFGWLGNTVIELGIRRYAAMALLALALALIYQSNAASARKSKRMHGDPARVLPVIE
jgi:transporter family-2 protein